MTIKNFSEIVGSEAADNLLGSSLQILYGLAGNDALTTAEGATSDDAITILIGGSGDNTYQLNNNSTSVVLENKHTNNDVIQAGGLGLNQDTSFVLTIENNRHLFVGDVESNQAVILIDWQIPENQIETFELEDGTFSYQDVASEFTSSPNYLGNISWEELRAESEIDILPENLDEAIVKINTRASVLESGDIIDFYRFRNINFETGTYIFVEEAERNVILANPDFDSTFSLEGVTNSGAVNPAFRASVAEDDNLLPFYRLRSLENPGTYLFVSTEEYRFIFSDDSNQQNKWVKEGLDSDNNDIPEFYLYGVGANAGVEFYRFQNRQNNTFLYASAEEADIIRSDPNLANVFLDQGVAFEAFL